MHNPCTTPDRGALGGQLRSTHGHIRGDVRRGLRQSVGIRLPETLTASGPRSYSSAVDKVQVLNVNVPGRVSRVDAAKYEAMKRAILEVVPAREPGLSAAEMVARVAPLLPADLWPNGEKVGWWQKTVQLDLEARGLLVRETGAKPLRWHRT